MASDLQSSLYDPNGELSEDEVATGQRTAAGPFYRCHLKPELVAGYSCRTMMFGTMGDKRYVIYARVTRSEAEEQGPGPMPLVLFDAARELQAEPLVVRVNITHVGPGIVFKYFGVNEAERLMEDLSEFWKTNSGKSPYRDWEVYLLRNLPMIGIGLYSRSGFFPDFILWVRHRQTNTVHIRFLDPHGLHHEGLGNNQDRFDAIAKLPILSQKPEFRTNQISMDAKLLVATELKDIPDRGDRGWPELQRDYPIVHQQDDGASTPPARTASQP